MSPTGFRVGFGTFTVPPNGEAVLNSTAPEFQSFTSMVDFVVSGNASGVRLVGFVVAGKPQFARCPLLSELIGMPWFMDKPDDRGVTLRFHNDTPQPRTFSITLLSSPEGL